MKCLEGLNPQQLEAVRFFDRNSMVFAGPGTGKTRVITSRIAYMLESGRLPEAKRVLAITFTNKAANEMSSRVASFGVNQKRVRIGTFHNFCMWVLKAYGDKIKMSRDFTFLTPNQQLYLLKQVAVDVGLMMKPNDFKNRISDLKNSSVDFEDYLSKTHTGSKQFSAAATEYQSRLYANNLIDYDDAILHAATLFKVKPAILELYQNAFPYILVDEMQDTNRMQLELIRLLGGGVEHVMAVADDDQSIYGWRGALPTVIQEYIDLLSAEKIILNFNYRSPQKVLDVANRLIKFNDSRTEKELIGRANETGDLVEGKVFPTWKDEAEWVSNKIKELHDNGMEYRQMIILYRSRHPSLKIIDEKLIEKGIPFQHFGKNFQNKKLLLTEFIIASMKLIADPSNDVVLSTLLNAFAQRFELREDIDLYNFYKQDLGSITLEKLAIMDTQDDIDEIIKQTAAYCLYAKNITSFVKIFDGLYKSLNIEAELRKYDETTMHEEKRHLDLLRERMSKSIASTITEMLAEMDLKDDSNHIDQRMNKVGVSTFHTAKGLEYKAVFIIALEDHFVPGRNGGMSDKVQEERRGLYVAVTRAESKLFITCAKQRTDWKGHLEDVRPSRFIDEMKKPEIAE